MTGKGKRKSPPPRRRRRRSRERAESVARRQRWVLYGLAGSLLAAVLAGAVVAIFSGGAGGESPPVEPEEIPEEAHVDPESGFVSDPVAFDAREGIEPPPLHEADLRAAAKLAGCELELNPPDDGEGHLRPGAPPPRYSTDPPSSGDHADTPAADGAYVDAVPTGGYLHALEHGRVAILYDPALPEEEQLAIKGVFDEDPQGLLLFPRPDRAYELAAVAWTRLVTCERYSPAALDILRNFRDVYRGQGPEDQPL
jgi:hypothetical protein